MTKNAPQPMPAIRPVRRRRRCPGCRTAPGGTGCGSRSAAGSPGPACPGIPAPSGEPEVIGVEGAASGTGVPRSAGPSGGFTVPPLAQPISASGSSSLSRPKGSVSSIAGAASHGAVNHTGGGIAALGCAPVRRSVPPAARRSRRRLRGGAGRRPTRRRSAGPSRSSSRSSAPATGSSRSPSGACGSSARDVFDPRRPVTIMPSLGGPAGRAARGPGDRRRAGRRRRSRRSPRHARRRAGLLRHERAGGGRRRARRRQDRRQPAVRRDGLEAPRPRRRAATRRRLVSTLPLEGYSHELLLRKGKLLVISSGGFEGPIPTPMPVAEAAQDVAALRAGPAAAVAELADRAGLVHPVRPAHADPRDRHGHAEGRAHARPAGRRHRRAPARRHGAHRHLDADRRAARGGRPEAAQVDADAVGRARRRPHHAPLAGPVHVGPPAAGLRRPRPAHAADDRPRQGRRSPSTPTRSSPTPRRSTRRRTACTSRRSAGRTRPSSPRTARRPGARRRSTASTSPSPTSPATSAAAACAATCSTSSRCRSTRARCGSPRPRTRRGSATSRSTTRSRARASITVLDEIDKRLVEVGRVGGLGKGERIYSVRFVEDVGFVVTFRQTDPLYTLDLSDRTKPRVVGELKIPGYSSYLHPIGDGLLIGVGPGRRRHRPHARRAGLALRRLRPREPEAPAPEVPRAVRVRRRPRTTTTRSCTGRRRACSSCR